MLKNFLELRELDVLPFCDMRKAKNEDGKSINVPYLPWANCLILLYENGANRVRYRAMTAPDGSFLFRSGETFVYTKNGTARECSCYFVSVEVEIDGETFTMPFPVLNGTSVVYNDTMNQLRVSNAIQRAFVKCVAVNTGLGISLWEKDDETSPPQKAEEEIFSHTPMLVKDAIERTITAKIQRGMTVADVFSDLGINKKQYLSIINGLTNASWLLGALK
ncbi:MAG: DUF1071 domain-containing protein [Ruminococcaceae bacterium]|nr:DUF1071 domain-containing protein [Oscillospiraceae bacterium]